MRHVNWNNLLFFIVGCMALITLTGQVGSCITDVNRVEAKCTRACVMGGGNPGICEHECDEISEGE